MRSRDPLIDLVRRRTLAGWIDVLVLFAVAVLISAGSGNAHVGSWTSAGELHHGVNISLTGGPFLLWVAIAVLYYSLDELFTAQTVGKRVMDLKVIMVNGRPLGGRQIALRTLARAIDVLPAFYLVGWILMRGPRRPPQRLGDRIAGTTVVRVSHP